MRSLPLAASRTRRCWGRLLLEVGNLKFPQAGKSSRFQPHGVCVCVCVRSAATPASASPPGGGGTLGSPRQPRSLLPCRCVEGPAGPEA